MWNERITIGLVTPKQEPKDVREMRKAILDASRDSTLIRNALDSQRYLGLNGEDAYTVLAYYALRELERHWQVNLAHLNATPSPSVIQAIPLPPLKHERRFVGHASGWQEPMDTCVCGQKWPCLLC